MGACTEDIKGDDIEFKQSLEKIKRFKADKNDKTI